MKKPSKLFWAFSAIGLLWNLMGVNQYLQQSYKTETFKTMYTADQLALIEQAPAWQVGAFALAVFGGALGCVLLLFRKKAAQYLFVLSLIGLIVQMSYNYFVVDSLAVFGPGGVAMSASILAFAIALLYFTKRHATNGNLS